MDATPPQKTPPRAGRRRLPLPAIAIVVVLAAAAWFWHARNAPSQPKVGGAVQVVSALVARTDLPVRFGTNGTVMALQAVDVRPQNTATIRTVHIKEGQFVRKGDPLFTLDTRTEDANLEKARAQAVKDRADLDNAERTLVRQQELFRQEYISRSELDAAQSQVDQLRGQLAADLAAAEASRVARSFDDIRAPIAGRTGAIAVYPGSLVQPSGTVLVNIAQIDPINVSFTLPEQQFHAVQQAFSKGRVPVSVQLDTAGRETLQGHLVFVDNAVDSASGSIRLKAEFPNPDHLLWPGMFVAVTLQPQILSGALTVPAQAVQTGPENKFLYAIGEGNKVSAVPVNVRLIQDGLAVVEGVAPGTRIVVEGAQNLRPGSTVAEQQGGGQNAAAEKHRDGNAGAGKARKQ